MFANIPKHCRFGLIVLTQDSDLCIEIQDDGIGFSPEDVSSSTKHGLRGMRERVELIGADFQVISRPGEGTTVRIRLPLQPVIEQGANK